MATFDSPAPGVAAGFPQSRTEDSPRTHLSATRNVIEDEPDHGGLQPDLPRTRGPRTGHLRVDLPLEILRLYGIDRDAPILFGGSTHAGEEEILGEIFLRLRVDFPAFTLIVAPRHVERAAEIRARLQRLGLNVCLRSHAGEPCASPPDCLLLDTTGELQHWYAVATIVFVGKSLTARGGQNPVEPILAGKPVLFGPHMENFSALAQALVANKAAVQVRDPNSLQQQIAWLLRDREAAFRLIANAQAVLARHTGATARTAALVLKLTSHH